MLHTGNLCAVYGKRKINNRMRFMVSEDKIDYPGELATPTANMLVTKILFNSIIYTKGSRLMTIDISKFYLITSLKRP